MGAAASSAAAAAAAAISGRVWDSADREDLWLSFMMCLPTVAAMPGVGAGLRGRSDQFDRVWPGDLWGVHRWAVTRVDAE